MQDRTKDLDTMIDLLAGHCEEIIATIENDKPATTKGHYQDYMLAIERLAEGLNWVRRTPSLYLAVGVALIRGGANRGGVQAALRAMGYL